MKTNYFLFRSCVLIAGLAACASPARENAGMRPHRETHDMEIRQPGVGSIMIDRVPNAMVMAGADSGFVSYKFRFTDSSASADPKRSEEMNRYYEYMMSRDWVLLVKGDSVRPVFYQPSIKRVAQVNEGVAVFETGGDAAADTLLFLDSRGIWGTHQLPLTDQ